MGFRIYIRASVRTSLGLSACISLSLYIYISIYLSIYIYMYMYMYMCVYIYIDVCIHIYIYIYTENNTLHVYTGICMYMYMYLFAHVCVYVRGHVSIMYVSMYGCMDAWMHGDGWIYVCMYVCMYMHACVSVCIWCDAELQVRGHLLVHVFRLVAGTWVRSLPWINVCADLLHIKRRDGRLRPLTKLLPATNVAATETPATQCPGSPTHTKSGSSGRRLCDSCRAVAGTGAGEPSSSFSIKLFWLQTV